MEAGHSFDLMVIGEQAVRENRAAAKADNTKRMLRVHWQHFEAWCSRHGVQTIPVDLGALERYLVELADVAGMAPRSIQNRLWAINEAHLALGHSRPGESEQIKLAIAGIRRRKARPPKQAAPLTVEQAKALPSCTLAQKRTRALILLGCTALLRSDELRNLDVENVQPSPYGIQVFIAKSKTDQESVGAWVDAVRAVKDPAACPVAALHTWINASRISAGPLFRPVDRHDRALRRRLGVHAINDIVKAAAATLGLDPAKYSSHSLRAGGATHLARQNAPVSVVARQGRWTNLDMVLRYYRKESGRDLVGTY